MDAAHGAVGFAAADLQLQTDGERRVRFVGQKVVTGAVYVADEPLRPMTFFAGLPCRTQIVQGRLNWPWNPVQRHVKKLVDAVELGFQIPFGPGTDVALDASDAGVGRLEIGRVFRLHRHMTRRAAKLNRVGVLISLIAADCGTEEKNQRPADERAQQFPVARTGQVDRQRQGHWFLPALHPETDNHQRDAEKEKNGRKNIDQNPHVGIAVGKKQFRGEQEQAGKHAAGGDQRADKAQPVAKQTLARGRRRIIFLLHSELLEARQQSKQLQLPPDAR